MANMIGMKNLIKKAAVDAVRTAKPVEITYGTVVEVQPIAIQLAQNLIIDEAFLVLTNMVMDEEVLMTHENGTSEKVIYHRSLSIGDNVLLFQVQGGQQYIVVDKVVER